MAIDLTGPSIFSLTGLLESGANFIVVSDVEVTSPQTEDSQWGSKEYFDVKFKYETPIRDENGHPTNKVLYSYGKYRFTLWSNNASEARQAELIKKYTYYEKWNGLPICSIQCQDLKETSYVSKNSKTGNKTYAFSVGAMVMTSPTREQQEDLAIVRQYVAEQQAMMVPMEEPEEPAIF